ncbi:hypothetical protein C6A77_19395 [Pseudomonas sp. AFG_SD02_1510_Pfu_092]|nr:hypothetical protein C6A77_19395 [Pseudomonas sp. AFG_SD02_1510_Pfu_092]
MLAKAREILAFVIKELPQSSVVPFDDQAHSALMYVGGYLHALMTHGLISVATWELLTAERDQAFAAEKARREG